MKCTPPAEQAVTRNWQVVVPCGCCDGAGEVVAQRLTEVWRVLSHDQWLSTQQVAAFVGIGGENAATMLARLHRAGLAERQKPNSCAEGTSGRPALLWKRPEVKL